MRKYTHKIYTIDVQTKEWFDNVNGNSYFGGIVTVNFGRKTEKVLKIPFQYGHGDHYKDIAFNILQDNKVIPKQDSNLSYWRYYEKNYIVVRHTKHENCLKRDVISYSS